MNETDTVVLELTKVTLTSTIALLQEIIGLNIIARSAIFLMYLFGIQILAQQMAAGRYLDAAFTAAPLLVGCISFWVLYRVSKYFKKALIETKANLDTLPQAIIINKEFLDAMGIKK